MIAGKAAGVTSPVTVTGAEVTGASGTERVQVTTAPAAAHAYPAPLADVKVTPAGSVSTMLNVATESEPTFVAVSVHVALAPTASVSAPLLAMAMFLTPDTGVVTMEMLFAFETSPVVCTKATFVTDGTASSLGVATRVTITLAPAESGEVRTQVTQTPATEQPKPGPAAETNVSRVGSESRT